MHPQPDGGIAGQLPLIKIGAAQQHLAGWQGNWLIAEVGHAAYAAGPCKMQYRQLRLDPAEFAVSEQMAAECERPTIETKRGARIRVLHAHGVVKKPVGLWQVRCLRTEPV